MSKSEIELRKREIGKEIDDLNIQMRTKKFDRYNDAEKAVYIRKQIALFTELKELSSFFDKLQINTMLTILESSLKKVL
jgi:hypothetical protein